MIVVFLLKSNRAFSIQIEIKSKNHLSKESISLWEEIEPKIFKYLEYWFHQNNLGIPV